MYISLRSPKGGSILNSIWAGVNKRSNAKLEPIPKPEALDDFVTFKAGYATEDIKKGDAIYYKRSEIKKLKPLIFHELID